MSVMEVPNPMVHKITLNPKAGAEQAKTKIEQILSEQEERAAQRYSVAATEKLALEAENEVAKMRGEPSPHKTRTDDDEEDEIEEARENRRAKRQARVIKAAQALLESGVEPEVAARMILQIPGEDKVQPPQNPNNLLEMAQVLEIFHNMSAPKDDGRNDKVAELINIMREDAKETRTLLAKLIAEAGGTRAEKVDPLVLAKNQAAAMTDLHNTMIEYAKGAGMVMATAESHPSTTIDEIKEKNRHEEEMVRIKGDSQYKASLAETVADIPVLVGDGIARNMRESVQSPVGRQAEPGGIESHICKCGTKIFAPPGSPRIKCPKCGQEYIIEADKPESKAGA
jgi:hypothetical protein